MIRDIHKPVYWKNMELKNGFIRSATNERMANAQHTPSEKLVLYYEQLAQHVGLIITGFCYPDPLEIVIKHMLGFTQQSQINNYRHLCQSVHRKNSKILLQIVAGGDHKTKTINDYTTKELKRLPSLFSKCACLAELAGFDGIQLHFAHRYLLSQCLNPNHNHRTDEYQGDILQRGALCLEILQAIKASVSKQFHISAKVHCADFEPGGMTLKESLTFARSLQENGLDSIEISGGDYRKRKGESYYYHEAILFANSLTIPVFCVGGNRDITTMEKQFKESPLAGFSMSHALICEPELPSYQQKSSCLTCNQCYSPAGRCILQKKEKLMFLSDFDGTLSLGNHIVKEKDIMAIRAFATSHVFGLISGRDPISLMQVCQKYHIPYDVLVCFNGALIIDLHGDILYEQPITCDIDAFLCDIKRSNAYTYHAVGYHNVCLGYREPLHEASLAFEKVQFEKFHKVSNISKLDKLYMFTCEFPDEDHALRYAQHINEAFPALHASANKRFIDVTKKGVTKGNVLPFLASYYDIDNHHIYTIGDSYNDIDLIQNSYGFAIIGNQALMKHAKKCVHDVSEALAFIKS